MDDSRGKGRVKSKLHVRNPLRVGGGAENLALILLEWFYPVRNVTGVLRNIGRDSDL